MIHLNTYGWFMKTLSCKIDLEVNYIVYIAEFSEYFFVIILNLIFTLLIEI